MNNDLYHYPRLNATSISHLEQLLLECSDNLSTVKFDVVYRGHTSNADCCPINGVRNFSDKSLPTGYPALEGSVEYTFKKDPDNRKDKKESWCNFAGVHSVYGFGERGAGYRLHVILFLDDFPLIKQAITEEQGKIQQAKDVAAKLYEQFHLDITQDPVIVDLDKNISHLTNEIAKLQKDLANVYAHKSQYVLDTHKQPLYDMYSEYKQSVGDLVYMKNFPTLDF